MKKVIITICLCALVLTGCKRVSKLANGEEKEVLENPVQPENKPNLTGFQFNIKDNTPQKETSIITEGMLINGDIQANGSLNLMGNIQGNINISGKLNISGNIEGNAQAAEIVIENAHINGNLKSDGNICVGNETIVIGSVTANSAAICGAIKGNVDVRGHVTIESTAIIMGDIKSKSVEISSGAVIEGKIVQEYAEINPKSFFGAFENSDESKSTGKNYEKRSH